MRSQKKSQPAPRQGKQHLALPTQIIPQQAARPLSLILYVDHQLLDANKVPSWLVCWGNITVFMLVIVVSVEVICHTMKMIVWHSSGGGAEKVEYCWVQRPAMTWYYHIKVRTHEPLIQQVSGDIKVTRHQWLFVALLVKILNCVQLCYCLHLYNTRLHSTFFPIGAIQRWTTRWWDCRLSQIEFYVEDCDFCLFRS